MPRSRIVLFVVSCLVVTLLAGGSLALRVGAADGAYGDVILFSELLALIRDNYVDIVDADGLLEGAYEGMLSSLDPRGAYLTPEEVAEWKRGGTAGDADPGIAVAKVLGSFEVASVVPGSPADESGIVAGDQIRQIDGQLSRNLSLDQALWRLRGEPGTRVTLEVLHPHRGFDRETVVLDRRKRTHPPYAIRVEDDAAVVTPGDLSRIDVDALGAELEELRSRGIERLLLDVRNVTEGTPRDALRIAELFTEHARLRLKDRSGAVLRTAEGETGRVVWGGPLAVLVNRMTVGAAEALTRALQDGSRARVYGEATYGLGAEPKLFELADGSGLVFSTAVWETETGASWHQSGIEPDRTVHGRGGADEIASDQLRRALEAFVEDTLPADEMPAAA